MHGSTNRRKFLTTSLAGTAAISLAGSMPDMLLGASRPGGPSENILVVVQMSGGNDGLNTIVPFGDDDYYKNRFTLAIGQNRVRKIDDFLGFHPALSGFESLYNDKKLAIVQGVGYPEPNRSHFESMDLWHTAHQFNEQIQVGWLGRTVDSSYSQLDLPALHLGRGLQPLALKTHDKPVPSIQSLEQFKLKLLRSESMKNQLTKLVSRPPTSKNDLLSYVYDSASVALATSHRLEALDTKQSSEFGYPGTGLGRDLSVIARLIGSGLSTRVYYTTLDGFDTHSNQAEAHAGLLRNLSDSIHAFMKEIESQGNSKRVCLFSFSEFGRRIRENASRGTDHGTAAPVFVFGDAVKAGVNGNHPSLSSPDENDDLRFLIDYRSVYADLLQNWLNVPSEPILGKPFDGVGIFS